MKIIKESKLNEAKSLEDKVADELEKVGLTAYAGGAYLGHMAQIETEEEKNKAQKVADKFGLETKEIPHKTYTDFYILIPEEEEKKPVKTKKKKVAKKKVKESLKRINEDITITNSPYKDEIAKYFKYTGDFEFLDLVADILSSIDDFTDDEDILYTVDNNLSYYSEAWKVFKHYCLTEINEDPKYNDDAYTPFVDDIFALCSIISEEETVEETEEEIVEESCKKEKKKELKEDENFDEELKKIAKGYQEDLKEIGTDWDKMLEYVNDQLDYDYNVDSKHNYRSAKLWVGLGGPNVCLDTEDAMIKIYWGSRRYEEPFSYEINEVLDDIMREIYNSERDSE